jgi:hypothetical protein
MVDRKASYITFTNFESLNSFLKRKTEPVVKDRIEHSVMVKFKSNRILFTAEHAQTKRIHHPEFGKHAYIGIGDKNTDVLAKLGAYYMQSAYIMPLFLRTEADAARAVEDLGRGMTMLSKVFYERKDMERKVCVPIHNDISYLPYLQNYHELIEHLNPKAIVSIHGMNVKRKFDVLFGFGKDYKGIGDKKTALEFKLKFIEYLDGVFRSLGMRNNLEIAVSTWFLSGSRNEVLLKHVIEYNEDSKNSDKRFGVQVEFNWRGRAMEADRSVPTIPYQLTVQTLGDFVNKWIRGEIK